jgi:predicted DNA-binding protein (UPF0251 family)
MSDCFLKIDCSEIYLVDGNSNLEEGKMANTSLDQSGIDYYLNTLCEMADHGFQFAYSCVLERSKAFEVVKNAYEELADNLPAPGDGDTDIIPVVAKIWSHIDQGATYSSNKGENKVFKEFFSKLSLEERAAISLVDYLGLETSTASKVIGKANAEIEQLLASSRKQLVAAKF